VDAVDLFYCIWTPGNHTPSGPIENVVDLRVFDCRGESLAWDRDPTRVERVTVLVPRGCDEVRVTMGYIASQPNANSRSTDTYGRRNFGGLNWNTVLVYPGGVGHSEIDVRPTVHWPAGWAAASALPGGWVTDAAGQAVRLGPVPLAELIDSPMIFGEHLATTRLHVENQGAHLLHTVAEDGRAVKPPEWLIPRLEEMCRQTVSVFGPFPRRGFDFLLLLGDDLRFGVEHATSTFIGLPERALLEARPDEHRAGGGGLQVIPHEYIHAWVGKLAAPEGLVRPDFHTPARTELLWVYEGLTAYYDSVISVRSGLTNVEEYRQEIADSAVAMQQRSGRLWRSVEDTARSARFLRPRGVSWFDIRRGQDYYGEAALFWLEADAIIRAGTGGAKSLDDFCAAFFNVPVRPVGSVHTYTRADVVAGLAAVFPGEDWDGLVRRRIERPAESLDMAPLLSRLGVRLDWADEPTALQKKIAAEDAGVNLRASIGLRTDAAGMVTEIVPGSPADRGQVAFTQRIVAANGWVYTPERLRQAVRESASRGRIELLVEFGDRIEPRTIEYGRGLRYPRLTAIEGADDVLGAIATPRAWEAPRRARPAGNP
ncbi:MAG: hypothetical protein IBJ11_06175, partial [Phycisphaerales bacterium]|nr:hypothetical protein [Phycisphaerales bacterium]